MSYWLCPCCDRIVIPAHVDDTQNHSKEFGGCGTQVVLQGCTPSPMRLYYYRPLAYYGGRVLKCAGHGAENEEHRRFYLAYFDTELEKGRFLPGVQVLEGYRGDRIDAVSHLKYDVDDDPNDAKRLAMETRQREITQVNEILLHDYGEDLDTLDVGDDEVALMLEAEKSCQAVAERLVLRKIQAGKVRAMRGDGEHASKAQFRKG